MDLKFNESVMKCLECVTREYQTQEQTQQIRIPDGMPDIAVVLACWGQPVLRGKDWRNDNVSVTGGVMVKILYMPEEMGPVQVLESWMPFQMKWGIPGSRQDGTMLVELDLRSADARVLGARKLMVRANVGVLMQAMVPMEFSVCKPEAVPEDVQLLLNRYVLSLPRDAGEKAFGLDDTLEWNHADPKPDQIVYISLSPQVLEQKVLSDKLIFRGLCIVHLLYKSADGMLHSRDLDLPFSQYAELAQAFEPEATVRIYPVVTNVELDLTPEGALHLKAGLSGQYVICDRVGLEIPQDAYSPFRTVEPTLGQLTVPAILDERSVAVSAQADPQVDVMKPVDIAFWPEQPYISRSDDALEADLSGTFQLLYYDPEGQLQSTQTRWEDMCAVAADGGASAAVSMHPGGKVHYSAGILCADLLVDTVVTAGQATDMLCGLELGEKVAPDPQRPSLILTKAGNKTLWQIAKENATTVAKIREANGLEGEPTPESVLLIPIL